jgi:hypothetical protein
VDSPHYASAIARIDAANAEDPNRTLVAGAQVPDELLYAQRMTAWLDRLDPDASEALKLAVRCQHICRWQIPRSTYPMTRPGYRQWRTALGKFHADKAGAILREVGYDAATIARVQSIVRKENLKDPETQTLEDVACLVFLEFEFADFARRHDHEKLTRILQRTWRKMSPRGQGEAMKLSMEPAARELIAKALTQPPAERSSRGESEEP